MDHHRWCEQERRSEKELMRAAILARESLWCVFALISEALLDELQLLDKIKHAPLWKQKEGVCNAQITPFAQIGVILQF